MYFYKAQPTISQATIFFCKAAIIFISAVYYCLHFKGWMNLLRGPYDPAKSMLSSTRSVLLRLDRDVVRLSIPKTNVMKHTFWNETKVEPAFISQELYNIAGEIFVKVFCPFRAGFKQYVCLGATISVRPKNLARRRWWSRKYPICITFAHGAIVGLTKNSQSDAGAIVSHQEQTSTDESDFCTGHLVKCAKKLNPINMQIF